MTIGITGGIGSGKSTIAQELAKRGFAVYDCDREAKRIIAENPDVQAAIIDLLGEEAFIKEQRDKVQVTKYNTAYVAKRVFEDPQLLERLNRIVHPAVKEDILSFIPSLLHSSTPLVIESAILFESGFADLCDTVFVVEAPEEVRMARTIARDYQGETTTENINKVRARMQAQKSPAGTITSQGKIYPIINDGSRSIAALVDDMLSHS